MIRAERGQAAAIGVVLLFGIVAVGSVTVFLVAGQTVSETQRYATDQHVTQGFVEFSGELETITYSSDASKTMDMAAGTEGAVRKENTGWINISTSGFSENISLGAVVYESEESSTIAYQAGGVWRGTGTETQMVSAPPVHYEDATLTLPVNSVTGDSELSSGRVAIEHNRTENYDNVSFVENEVVTLEIKSEYYVGWKEYFTSATNEAVVDEVDHDANTVTIELGRPDLEGAFDNGITVSENVTDNGGTSFDDDEIKEGVYMPEFDPVITNLVEDTNTSDKNVGTVNGSTGTFTSGTYFADEIDLSSDVAFDLTDGNATLVVDGDVTIEDGSLLVENWTETDGPNKTLKIYANRSLTVQSEMCVEPCTEDEVDSEQLQVYGTSKMVGNFKQGNGNGNGNGNPGTYFEGVLYAPSDDPNQIECGSGEAQICVHSNGKIDGGIVTGSAHFQSESNGFEYDPTLKNSELSTTPDDYLFPPKITYLNVVVHEINVKDTR